MAARWKKNFKAIARFLFALRFLFKKKLISTAGKYQKIEEGQAIMIVAIQILLHNSSGSGKLIKINRS